ncbi:MAG TPA: 50S ribosomal protein L10 [Bacilli bacterium]|nr:50S ribosomal protein L10 [Bacilli bacterium]
MNEATIAKKNEHVEEVVSKFNDSASTLFVDYLGLTVFEITELRVKLYKERCEMKVVKNNILRRAADKVGYQGLEETFKGPSAAIFSKDQVAASKILFGFAKDHKKLTIKSGVVDGKTMTTDQLKTLSTLPNKLGMVSMLLSVLQAPIRNLAYAVKSVAEKE